MFSERQENIKEYEAKKTDDLLKNAELCDEIASWGSSDREVIFWKKKGLEIREEIFGKKSSEIGKFYDEMSDIYLYAGTYKQSLKFCKKALKIKEKEQENYFEILKIYTRIIENYYYLSDWEKGISLALHVLSDVRTKEEPISEDIIQIIRVLIFMYRSQGNKEKMWKWIEEGIIIAIKYFGENSIQVAQMYVEKARYLTDKTEKLKLFKTALEIFLNEIGMYDKRTQRTYRCIWECWEGETKQPIKMALEWLEKNISQEHFIEILNWLKRG